MRQINITNNDSYNKMRSMPSKCTIHVNPIKMNISKGLPDKIARRGKIIISGSRLLHKATMNETGYEKWKESIGLRYDKDLHLIISIGPWLGF
jgi:hypothetical protein